MDNHPVDGSGATTDTADSGTTPSNPTPNRPQPIWVKPSLAKVVTSADDFSGFVVIKTFVDVLAALHHKSMAGSVFAFDSNRRFGSTSLGTDQLATVVQPGDSLLWIPLSLECEAFVDIVSIEIPGVEVKRIPVLGAYCWSAQPAVPTALTHYRVTFELGHLGLQLPLNTLALVGPPETNSPAAAAAPHSGPDR